MLQVNSVLSTNQRRNQWVDLGIHTDVCMTWPQTCGAAGGAISLWLSVTECSTSGGILAVISGSLSLAITLVV